MGQYHKLINLTKKEYVNPYEIGLGAKHLEGIGFDSVLGILSKLKEAKKLSNAAFLFQTTKVTISVWFLMIKIRLE